jgi:nifR3 family TIM-barrel protein
MRIGPLSSAVPVVLAPMAGITNEAYRRLCREHALAGVSVAKPSNSGADLAEPGSLGPSGPSGRPAPVGLFLSEMVTSRALLERNAESLRLIAHHPDEHPRSVQLYGVDPVTVGAAVRMLVDENLADHIDLNFGCPVPKVTRKGGGAALPWKLDLFGRIVAAAVRAAEPAGIPVTVKLRMGIDENHLTYLEAGRRAADEGVAAVALHARTAADHYSGRADRSAIARLKEALPEVPVLGNGDIWTAADALSMVAETGCDGVVVGRGCLGRPWLFTDLAAAFTHPAVSAGQIPPAGSATASIGSAGVPHTRLTLGRVLDTMRRHLDLLVQHYAEADGVSGPSDPGQAELRGCRDIRKHVAWYLKGYQVGSAVRLSLAHVTSVAEFRRVTADLDRDQPYPGPAAEGPRGRTGSSRRVSLPDGWLEDRGLRADHVAGMMQAETAVSGG